MASGAAPQRAPGRDSHPPAGGSPLAPQAAADPAIRLGRRLVVPRLALERMLAGERP